MTAQGISERRAGRQARGTSLQREVRRGIRGVEDRCSAPCPNSGCLMFDQPNRVPPERRAGCTPDPSRPMARPWPS